MNSLKTHFFKIFIIIYRQEFYVWVALGSLDP
jgi:hypothetical protein